MIQDFPLKSEDQPRKVSVDAETKNKRLFERTPACFGVMIITDTSRLTEDISGLISEEYDGFSDTVSRLNGTVVLDVCPKRKKSPRPRF